MKEISHSYLITHHLRDVDRYMGWGYIATPKVYALLRTRRPYASVSAFAGSWEWGESIQRSIKVMMQEVSISWRVRGYQRPPRVTVTPHSAHADHVAPEWAEWLCQELAWLISPRLADLGLEPRLCPSQES